MKQKRVLLIALVAILLVSVGAIVYLTQNTTDPETEGDSIHVLNYSRSEVEAVFVENEKDSFSFEVADNEIGYACEKIGDLPQLLSNYVSIIDSVCSVDANSEYRGADLSRYGLDAPQASVRVVLKDGEEYTLQVGSRAPTENYVYFMVSTDPGTVYTARMSKFSPVLADAYSLVNRLLAPKTESPRAGNDETDTAHSLEFSNRNGEVFHLDQLSSSYTDGAGNSYRYHQTAPSDSYIQASKVQNVFDRVMQFCASSVYVNHPTAEDMEKCGLNDPLTFLTLGYNGEYATIYLSEAPSGNYYAFKEGMDVIWNVADYLVTWLDVTDETMKSSYVLAPPMSSVNGLAISFAEETFNIQVNDDGTAKINQADVNSGDFSRLYALACSVNSENRSTVNGGETVAEIRFNLKEGMDRTVTLRRGEARTLIIYVDGAATGLSIRESYADTLLQACKAVENHESFSTNW